MIGTALLTGARLGTGAAFDAGSASATDPLAPGSNDPAASGADGSPPAGAGGGAGAEPGAAAGAGTTPGASASPRATAARGTATARPGPTSTATAGGGKSGTFTGSPSTNRYGTITVTVTFSAGRMTAVNATYPTTGGETAQINARAIPRLRQEALTAQSASIATVSGATYTSNSFKASLQSALAAARK